MIMTEKAVEPTVERTGYTEHAVPQKTPDRSVETSKKRYRVIGTRQVYEYDPGEVVELELTEGQERTLINSGHLEEVPDEPAVDKEED